MARACRLQFHLGPFRAAFLALLLITFASGTATASTKAEHLYLLAGTPTLYSTRGRVAQTLNFDVCGQRS